MRASDVPRATEPSLSTALRLRLSRRRKSTRRHWPRASLRRMKAAVPTPAAGGLVLSHLLWEASCCLFSPPSWLPHGRRQSEQRRARAYCPVHPPPAAPELNHFVLAHAQNLLRYSRATHVLTYLDFGVGGVARHERAHSESLLPVTRSISRLPRDIRAGPSCCARTAGGVPAGARAVARDLYGGGGVPHVAPRRSCYGRRGSPRRGRRRPSFSAGPGEHACLDSCFYGARARGLLARKRPRSFDA